MERKKLLFIEITINEVFTLIKNGDVKDIYFIDRSDNSDLKNFSGAMFNYSDEVNEGLTYYKLQKAKHDDQ